MSGICFTVTQEGGQFALFFDAPKVGKMFWLKQSHFSAPQIISPELKTVRTDEHLLPSRSNMFLCAVFSFSFPLHIQKKISGNVAVITVAPVNKCHSTCLSAFGDSTNFKNSYAAVRYNQYL